MRAVQVKEFGGPEVLEVRQLPAPQPGSAEVVVDVEVADVMFLDTRLRGGWGHDRHRASATPLASAAFPYSVGLHLCPMRKLCIEIILRVIQHA